MANQTELLNVSDEMKLDDERQSFEGLECGEGLCSSSSDTTEELYSSSAPDTCGDCVPLIPRKIYNVINVKVEFGDGEDKISLDAIAERAKKYQPKPKVK